MALDPLRRIILILPHPIINQGLSRHKASEPPPFTNEACTTSNFVNYILDFMSTLQLKDVFSICLSWSRFLAFLNNFLHHLIVSNSIVPIGKLAQVDTIRRREAYAPLPSTFIHFLFQFSNIVERGEAYAPPPFQSLFFEC